MSLTTDNSRAASAPDPISASTGKGRACADTTASAPASSSQSGTSTVDRNPCERPRTPTQESHQPEASPSPQFAIYRVKEYYLIPPSPSRFTPYPSYVSPPLGYAAPGAPTRAEFGFDREQARILGEYSRKWASPSGFP